MKRYALVETGTDVEKILESSDPSGLRWVAVSPFCIPFMESRGIPCVRLDDGEGPPEIFADVNAYTEPTIDNLISTVDSWVKANYDDFNRLDLSLLRYCRYYLTILFDGACYRLCSLDRFLSTEKPDEIIVHVTRVEQKSEFSTFPWRQDETVWAYCVETLLKEKYPSVRLSMVETRAQQGSSADRSWGTRGKTLKRFPRLHRLLKTYRDEGLATAVSASSGENLVLLNDKQWRFAAPYLKELGYNIVPQSVRKSGAGRGEEVDYLGRTGFDPYLRYKGVDLTGLIGGKINKCIRHGLTTFAAVHGESEKILDIWKAKAVLFSVIDRPEDWVTVQAARRKGCPAIAWGHGASGQASFTKQYRNEVMTCDYYFTQGLASQKTYGTYGDYAFTPKPVGFPTLDDLGRKLAETNGAEMDYDLIFAPTNYYKNNFYFSFYPGMTDPALYDVHRKIISFLRDRKCRSLLKIGLGNYFADFFREAFGKEIEIESKRSLPDLIPHGGAYIVDFPTTTLLEVLSTERPVFVLTQFVKLSGDAERLLSKRAVCRQRVDELIEDLDAYLAEGRYGPDRENREYLLGYGTFLGDGLSAKRGAETVKDILRA